MEKLHNVLHENEALTKRKEEVKITKTAFSIHKPDNRMKGVIMKIHGLSQNLELFNRHFLKVLDNAGMDYMKALPQVEIFLGEEFYFQANNLSEYQLYYKEIDSSWFNSQLLRALGRMIQKIYLSNEIWWEEIESGIGYKLDHNVYHSRFIGRKYCPAEDIIADIFEHAINNCRQITFTQIGQTIYSHEKLSQEEGPVKRIRIDFEPHYWRSWFYALWDQNY